MSAAKLGDATQRDIIKEENDLHNDSQPARKIVIKGRRVQKRVKKLYFEESDETESEEDEHTDHLDKRKTAQSNETNDDLTRIFGLRNVFTNNLLPGKILNHWSDSKPAVSLLNATNTVFSRIANTSFLRDKHEEFGTQQNKANTVTESPFKAVEKQSEKLLASEADITNESNEWDNDDWGDSWEDHWGNEDGSKSNISDENAPSVKKSSSDFIQSKTDAFTQLIDSNVRSQPKPEIEKSEPKSDDHLLNNDGWNEDWGNEKDTNVALNEAPDEIPDFEPPEPETTLEMISNDLIVHVAEASKCEKEQSEILLSECLIEKVPDNQIMNENGWSDNWASEDVTHSSVSDQILLIEKSSTESFESKSDASSQLIEDDEHSQPKPEAESKDVETKSENQWDDDWRSEDDTKSKVSDQIVILTEKSSDLFESKLDASSPLIEDDVHFQPKPEAEKKVVETKFENQCGNDWGNEDDTKSNVSDQIVILTEKSSNLFESKSDASSQFIEDDVHFQPKPEAEKKDVETKSDNQWNDDWENEDDTNPSVSVQNSPSANEPSTEFDESKSNASSQLIKNDVHSQPKPEVEGKAIETKSDDHLLNENEWNDVWGNEEDTNVALNEAPDEILDFEPPEPETTLEMISNDLIVHVAEASKCEKEQSEILLTECLTEKVPDNPIMNESGWNDNWASEDVTHSSVSDQILLIEKSSTGSFESKSDASSQLIEDDEHSQPKPEAESNDVETKSENQWDDDWGNEDDTKSSVSDQIVIPKEKSSDLSESKSNASSQLIEDDMHFQPKPEAEKKVVETKSENQCGNDWGNEDDTNPSVSVQNCPSANEPSTEFDESKSNASSQLIKNDVHFQPNPEVEGKTVESKSDNNLLNNEDWNDDRKNGDDTNVALNEAPNEILDFEPPEPETTLEMISNDLIVHVAEASKCEKEQSEILLTECLAEKVLDNPIMNESGWNDNWASEDVTHSSVSDQILLIEKSSTGSFESKSDASSQLIEDDEHSQPKPEAESNDVETKSENQWDDDWGNEDDTKSSVPVQIIPSADKPSTGFFGSKSDPSSQLIKNDVHSQPKPDVESKAIGTKSDNQWDDDWGNEDDTKSNVSDQIVILTEKSSNLFESKSDASSQFIEDDVHFQPKPEAEKKDVETKSDNQWDDNWGNEDDTKSSVPVQIISSADKPSTGFFGSKSDPSSQLIKDDVRSQPKPEAEKKAETQSDNQLLNNDDWNDDWGNYDEDSKPNVSALGKSKPTVDSKQMLSKLNTSNNLSTNNVSAQPKLQTSELKAKEDKPILVKKTKSKVTSTAKLFSSSTSTQLKAPVKSKNEWANDDWGNDWDDFEPLTLSDRRSSAQTDLSIDSDWSADWEVKPKPKVQKHPKPSPSTTFPRASKSISDDHFISNQQLKPTPSSSSTSDSQIMNDQQSVMQNQYKPTLSQQQTGEASGASWFSDFRSATRTAALTTVTHAVNRWSFNPTNILDAVVENISSAVGVPSAEEMATVMRQQQRKK